MAAVASQGLQGVVGEDQHVAVFAGGVLAQRRSKPFDRFVRGCVSAIGAGQIFAEPEVGFQQGQQRRAPDGQQCRSGATGGR